MTRISSILAVVANIVFTVTTRTAAAPIAPAAAAGVVVTDRPLISVLASKQSNAFNITNAATAFLGIPALRPAQTVATVFAPTDAALSAFLVQNPALAKRYSNDAEFRKAVLSYHIVLGQSFMPKMNGRVFFSTANAGMLLRADVTTEPVTNEYIFSVGPGFGKPASIIGSIVATNGIIHIIDSVLLEPMPLSATLVGANLTGAATSLKNAGLSANIDRLKNVTFFAPSNEAIKDFNAVFNLGKIVPSFGLLSSLMNIHITPRVLTATDIITAQARAAVAHQLPLKLTSGVPTQNITAIVNNMTGYTTLESTGNTIPALVIRTDIIFAGGILHVIDKVLLPSQSALIATQNLNETILPQFIPSA